MNESRVFDSLIAWDDLAALARLAEATPPGAFVEVGVYRGGSASVLYKIAQEQGRELHLYDTFCGHPVVDPLLDDQAVHPAGRFAEALSDLAMLQREMPKAHFHVGTFPETLVDMGPVAFVHADVDLYWPTLAICKLLPPSMVSGGKILFDDYPYTGCPGVRRAVDEVFTTVSTVHNGKVVVTIP